MLPWLGGFKCKELKQIGYWHQFLGLSLTSTSGYISQDCSYDLETKDFIAFRPGALVGEGVIG